jgi:AcrR family transcriptional regulator
MTSSDPTRGPDGSGSTRDRGKRVRRTRSITAEDREHLRLLILECAMREFAQKGYENTSIDTIAEQAGVGKGTVYRYSASKEHLLEDVLDLVAARFRAWMDEALAKCTGKSAEEQLRVLIDTVTTIATEHPEVMAVYNSVVYNIQSYQRLREPALLRLRRLRDMYTGFFTSLSEHGEIRLVDCEALGVILLSLLYAYVRVPTILGYADKVGSEGWNGLLTDLLWHGLAPEVPAKKISAATGTFRRGTTTEMP